MKIKLNKRETRGNHLYLLPFSLMIFLVFMRCSDDSDEITAMNIEGDLIIDNEAITYENQDIHVHGNVIVRNGGHLTMKNSTLNIVGSYDEEYSLYVLGSSNFESYHSGFVGEDYQTSMICEEREGNSPTVYFENSYANNHLGIRPFDQTKIVVKNSKLEEINVLDQSSLTLTGGSENYIVLFFDDSNAELTGLHTGSNVSHELDIPGGWHFEAINAGINGYQVDASGNSEVYIQHADGITISIHTSGNAGVDPIVLENVTSVDPADGAYLDLGPAITYSDTQIEYFNIYLHGSDKVVINGGIVNEANTFESSSLVIKNCSLEYNLVQSYDQSNILIMDCEIASDPGFTPSVTSDDESLIEIKRSDCRRLTTNALSNSTIKFYDVHNLNQGDLNQQDNGKIYVDDVQVK